MKLNQGELDAVSWKIVEELRGMRKLTVEIAQNKAKQEFEKDLKLRKAWDLLRANTGKKKYKIELTFLHPKVVNVPAHYEVKSRLVISQIGAKDIAQTITDLTLEIAKEIGL